MLALSEKNRSLRLKESVINYGKKDKRLDEFNTVMVILITRIDFIEIN